MTEKQKWLELERLEYMGEIEKKRRLLDEQILQIKADHARRGLLHSGVTNRSIDQVRSAFRRDLIETRIAIRKQFSANAPDLLLDAELDGLQEALERTVQLGIQADRDDAQRQNAAAGRTMPSLGEHEVQAKAGEQVALIRREISKLKLQRGLGMEQKRESSIVLNINNSSVSGLNLGSIVGDMNATLTLLTQQGNRDLATALKTISEAIASDEQLGGQRRELLENISILGDEGKVPVQQRRTGIVKAAYRYLGETIAIGGHAAAIWGTWGPQIAAFFGIPR